MGGWGCRTGGRAGEGGAWAARSASCEREAERAGGGAPSVSRWRLLPLSRAAAANSPLSLLLLLL